MDEQADDSVPRRLAAVAEVASAAPAPIAAGEDTPRRLMDAGSRDIATLPAVPAEAVASVIDPQTGEPARPGTIVAASIISWVSVAVAAVAMLTAFWFLIPDFSGATWLTARVPAAAGSVEQVLLAVAVAACGLLPILANTISGFYCWQGFRWSRVGALIGTGASLLLLMVNPIGWAVAPLAAVAAVLAWLPPSERFFTAWQARRHPAAALLDEAPAVHYGPLPRFSSL